MRSIKFIFFSILASALVLAGCDQPCEECGKGHSHVIVDLAGSTVSTKALAVPSLSESNVVRCVLYVFNQQGQCVKVLSSPSGSYDFYLTDDTYDFVAVVNKSGLPEENPERLTKRDLMAVVAALADNAVGSLVMAGSQDQHVIQGDEKITIEVRRLVSKVDYRIRTEFKGTLATLNFVIEDIYMTNVVGDMDLAVSALKPAAGDTWFNKMNAEPAGQSAAGYPADLLFGHLGRTMAMPKDSIWTTNPAEPGHTFYVYPNESADDHNKDSWSPRCTRFVVKATLGDKTTYYPVTLPTVGRNKAYHIDLTITNYGVDHPEDKPDKYEYIEAFIRVADWEEGGTIHSSY